jgi:hypothetical protein
VNAAAFMIALRVNGSTRPVLSGVEGLTTGWAFLDVEVRDRFGMRPSTGSGRFADTDRGIRHPS